ncbi:MAG: hypothetical protein JST77_01320, partial [Acidobacteria bacterium]|nr:hypothetical protein [Acidobacteriota bacterium]
MKPSSLRFFLAAASFATLVAAWNTRSVASAANSGLPQWFRSDVYAELGKAPDKDKHRANPLENDPQAVAAGQILFQDRCSECHGEDAKGA